MNVQWMYFPNLLTSNNLRWVKMPSKSINWSFVWYWVLCWTLCNLDFHIFMKKLSPDFILSLEHICCRDSLTCSLHSVLCKIYLLIINVFWFFYLFYFLHSTFLYSFFSLVLVSKKNLYPAILHHSILLFSYLHFAFYLQLFPLLFFVFFNLFFMSYFILKKILTTLISFT